MSDESFSAIEETRFRFCEEIALLNLFLPIFDWHVHVGQEVVVHPSSKINQSSLQLPIVFQLPRRLLSILPGRMVIFCCVVDQFSHNVHTAITISVYSSIKPFLLWLCL